MTTEKLIAPSILSADFANLAAEIERVTTAGADWIHVDVMDGHFVPNLTIGAPVVRSLKKHARIPLDVHLMVENPEVYVEPFAAAGADHFCFHIEATKNPGALIELISAKGMKPGITLKPRTPLAAIEPYLDRVFLALVMTVEPGFGGQVFMEDQIAKIDRLWELRKERNFDYLIEVDGGITDETITCARRADAFVAGNFVFKQDYRTAIDGLRRQATGS